MSEIIDHGSEHIVSAARALLEQHGFAVVHSDAEAAPAARAQTDAATDAGAVAADWITLFRATLLASLQTGDATLSELAHRLAVSPRTLQRQLAAHGTSLRAEINTARRDLANRLSQNGATNSLIALRLGYSDTRALRRAVRRWRTASSTGVAR
jgi:AraC-like DNA-binding protein